MNIHTPLDPHVAAINGRQCLMPRKTRRCFARFDDDEILAIRQRWEAGASIVDLADAYNAHRGTISAIVNYHRYNHQMPDTKEAAE